MKQESRWYSFEIGNLKQQNRLVKNVQINIGGVNKKNNFRPLFH